MNPGIPWKSSSNGMSSLSSSVYIGALALRVHSHLRFIMHEL